MALERVAGVNDVPEGGGKEVEAAGKVIALYKLNGKFYAIGGMCLHKGGPLAGGMLDGNVVTCPLHGWQYDITNGKCVGKPVSEPSYKVQVQGNDIFLEI